MDDPDRLKNLLEALISLGLCSELEAHAKAYGAEHSTAYWCGAMETLISYERSRRRTDRKDREEKEEKQ